MTIEAEVYAAGVTIFTRFVGLTNCHMVVDAAELDAGVHGRCIAIIAVIVVLAAAVHRLARGEIDVVDAFVIDALVESALVHILALRGAVTGTPGNR